MKFFLKCKRALTQNTKKASELGCLRYVKHNHRRTEHEAPHRPEGAAGAVRGGEQGRRGLPLLPPRATHRHGRQAGREGGHGRLRRQPLRQRRQAGLHLRAGRRRQGRAALPYRAVAGSEHQQLPPPPAGEVFCAAQDFLQVRLQQQQLPCLYTSRTSTARRARTVATP